MTFQQRKDELLKEIEWYKEGKDGLTLCPICDAEVTLVTGSKIKDYLICDNKHKHIWREQGFEICKAELKGLQEGYDLALKELHKKESEAHHKGYKFAKAEDLKIVDKVLNPCNLTYEDYEGNEDEWFWFRQQELKAEISKEGTK